MTNGPKISYYKKSHVTDTPHYNISIYHTSSKDRRMLMQKVYDNLLSYKDAIPHAKFLQECLPNCEILLDFYGGENEEEIKKLYELEYVNN